MSVVIDGSNGINLGAGSITFPDATTQNSSPIGVGQAWQDITASRAYGTNYTNNTGKPICISITGASAVVSSVTITVAGVIAASSLTNDPTNGSAIGIGAIVPNGAIYSATGTGALGRWSELR